MWGRNYFDEEEATGSSETMGKSLGPGCDPFQFLGKVFHGAISKGFPDLDLEKQSVAGEFVEIIPRRLCNDIVTILMAGHSKGNCRVFQGMT